MADLAHAAEGDTDLHGDFNARHWAERFASYFEVHRLTDIGDRGIHEPLDTMDLMLTWFAGAIMTGHDVALSPRGGCCGRDPGEFHVIPDSTGEQ